MAFVNPEGIVRKYFDLLPGMVVADFGAGSGHYVFPAAELVKDQNAAAIGAPSMGLVYAIDIQKDLLEKIKSLAREKNLKNIEIIWGNLDKEEGSRLATNSVDFVIISNLFFQAENREGVAKEAMRALKNGGRVAVVDWSESFGGLGPRQAEVFNKQACEKLFLESGFVVDKEFDAGEHHYGIIFKKP